VAPDDVLFVHGGMQSALRVAGETREQKMDTVIDALEAAVPEGALMLPTFTYSFCADEDFDVELSPSTVGMLSEHFRHRPGVRRTPEPIFSVAVQGPLPEDWERRVFAVGDVDCFGEDSVFAYLYVCNANLLFFGIGFEYCTFLYFVEQRLGVDYRYFKDFRGDVVARGDRTAVTASYFVRDIEAGVENSFLPLAEELRSRGLVSEARLPRGPRILRCRARDVHDVAVDKLREQPDYLLTRGHVQPPAA
jgi:aminoglycoside 3-N-acetyltransferase